MPNEEPSGLLLWSTRRNSSETCVSWQNDTGTSKPIFSRFSTYWVRVRHPAIKIPGVTVEVYKVRAQNTDSGKGKSGGYRIIYQRTTEGVIVLVTLYSKAEQGDIAPHEIRRILLDYTNLSDETDDAEAEEPPSETEKGTE